MKEADYNPEVCPQIWCLGYGDSVPAQYGRCFLCNTPVVNYTEIPYKDVDPSVRRVLERKEKDGVVG